MSSGGSATAEVLDDLGGGAAGAEQDHRTEQAILEHTEQKLMRVRPHDHRLHGEALQPRIRPRLGHAGDHRLGGAARFGGATRVRDARPPTSDLCEMSSDSTLMATFGACLSWA